MTRTQANSAFLNWLAAQKYTPHSILEPSILDNVRRVYVPYYSFYVEYSAAFRASVGYHRWEQYTQWDTVYENGRTRRVPRTATKLEVDWHPYRDSVSNRFSVAFVDRIPGGNDFAAFLNDTMFKNGELVPSTSVAEDSEILPFTRTPEASYNDFVKDAIDRRVLSQIKGCLPGDTHRDLSYDLQRTNHRYWRVYLPFWHFLWKYEDEVHGALVDGRQHTRVAGRLPKDKRLQQSANDALKPLWLALGLAFVLSLLTGFVEVPSELQTGLYAIISVAAAAVGFGSYQRRHQVLGDAQALRKEAVEKILSSRTEN